MDIGRFGDFKTGRLEPIKLRSGREDWAFIPNPLPPTWRPNDKIWALLAEARDRVGQLNAAGSFLRSPALLLRPLQRREALKSNTIEGTHVTPQELLLFEAAADQAENAPRVKRNDWQEVHYYDLVLNEGCKLISAGGALDRAFLRTLHERLLSDERGKDKAPGQFRVLQVFVSAGGRYIPPPPEQVDECLIALEAFLATDREYDPLIRAFLAHYQFEAIHPFLDGNGRLGRILLSLCIFKWLNHSHAWLYMSEFFERHRKDYFEKLFGISTAGEWSEWIEFCLIGAIEQAERGLSICTRLNSLKDDYEQRVGQAARMHIILKRLFSNPIFEIAELARELKVSYHTARKDVDHLIELGIASEMERQHPRTFAARQIFDIAYGN